MQLLGLQVRRSYKFKSLTDTNHKYPFVLNLLNQNFKVDRANQAWVSDMTYISNKQGWVYLTVIIDLFNRKVVEWSFSKDLTTENNIISAWKMAVQRTDIKQDLIFHFDRGTQYASHAFTGLIKSYNCLVKVEKVIVGIMSWQNRFFNL